MSLPRFQIRFRPGKAAVAAIAAAVLLFGSFPAAAGVRPAAEQSKIDKLLDEIRDSGGTFVRNGDEVDGPKAADHLRRKLDWAGSKIQSAREFIVGVASRSERTGEPYLVRLTGEKEPRPLREWLLDKLGEIEAKERGRLRK